ncbi:protein MANBAL [Elysia marginata]|uniref:Protein MANBAL n=1 Tax=Elysia marginata TaxID=1093978 RepID=A0AAV4FSW6_9GAST|nr:protein MANBAL [Elysia marginata]
MAIILEEPTFFENILNYALFAGAIFQLVCIFAAITISQSATEKEEEAAMKLQMSTAQQALHRKLPDSVSKRGKKEKKKHR